MLFVTTKSGTVYEVDKNKTRIRQVHRVAPGGSRRLATGSWLNYEDLFLEIGSRMVVSADGDHMNTSIVTDILDSTAEGN